MFSIVSEAIDELPLRQQLISDDAGALVTFLGIVRNNNEGKVVAALEYEAYEPLASLEGKKILEEAQSRFTLLKVLCVHRVGVLSIGETAVWIGVLCGHRGDAFEGCQYMIDELKKRVPIWKKEHYVTESTQWVNSSSKAPTNIPSPNTST